MLRSTNGFQRARGKTLMRRCARGRAYGRRLRSRSGQIGWTGGAGVGKLHEAGKGSLDHLRIDSAYVMGGCMGCSVALAFGVHYPERARALLLHWPVGGYRWKVNGWSGSGVTTISPRQTESKRLSSAHRPEKVSGPIRSRALGVGDRTRSTIR